MQRSHKDPSMGSAEYVQLERENATKMTNEYIDEFHYLAQDDVRWLNAHMEGLLSSAQLNLTQVLKTPGKLKGKTPRVTRADDKSDRAPLTDIFSQNPQSALSPAQTTPFYQKVSKINVAVDPPQKSVPFTAHATKENVDSGYQGSTEDETDAVGDRHTNAMPARSASPPKGSHAPTNGVTPRRAIASPSHGPSQLDKDVIHNTNISPAIQAATIGARTETRSERVDQTPDLSRSDTVVKLVPSPTTAPFLDPSSTKTDTIAGLTTLPTYPTLPTSDLAPIQPRTSLLRRPILPRPIIDEDDEDWIPVQPKNDAPRPTIRSSYFDMDRLSGKSLAKPPSISPPRPDLTRTDQTLDTPARSPSQKKYPDGPLSASKAKIYSVLKSAKGKFATSAGASAQAKLDEAPPPDKTLDTDMSTMPGAFAADPSVEPETRPPTASVISGSLRSVRSALATNETQTKAGKATNAVNRTDKDLDKARDEERVKAAAQKAKADAVQQAASQKAQTTESSNAVSQQPLTAQKSQSRLAKPTPVAAPARPQNPVPVNIRVASQSQRLATKQPLHSATAPDAEPNVRPSSAQDNSTITNGGAHTRAAVASQNANARVKALDAAARKKEQDEKAATRKADQKREIEQRRAAKADEQAKEQEHKEQERRTEEQRRQREESQARDAKLAAQRQAEQKRAEQQRKDAVIRKPELTSAASHGTLRQLTKPSNAQDLQTQASKVIKRVMQQDDDSGTNTSQSSTGSQQDAKRRKTNDFEEPPFNMAPVPSMTAPPKRPSHIRQESNLGRFPHGYTQAPPTTSHNTQNMFKATVTAQHQLHHGSKLPSAQTASTVLHSNARIPFSDHAQPHASSSQPVLSAYPAPDGAKSFKTPARPNPANSAAKVLLKSSPACPNGENVILPEINTDSEDEDSDSEADDKNGNFRAPSWVASPALRELLSQQQLTDPETVFGPIAPLHMDEVFRNGKNADRLKKFRDRTSSAQWVQTGDAVTADEKRRDQEARAKVVRDGGWSFNKDV